MPTRPLPPTSATPRDWLLALSLCLGLSACAIAADAATLKGKVYPDEHKVLKAEESGFEVLQLTTNPADDSGLYFTSQSFVPDDNGLVFTSKRTGAWNLFYMNLKDFTFVQLTDGKNISGTGAMCVRRPTKCSTVRGRRSRR